MANNATFTETPADTSLSSKDNSVTIAIILPALFAIVLIMLIAVALLMPRCARAETAASKEERRRKRMARLESSVKAQHWVDWAKKQQEMDPKSSSTVHALW
jgi:E3 ubiquitin-protein ligase RHA2